jgi:hypothetical protein
MYRAQCVPNTGEKVNEKTNKVAFIGLAFLPFAVLASEMLVVLVESLFYGTTELWTSPLRTIIHWVCTIIVWSSGLFLLTLLSKKAGYNVFESADKPALLNWVIIGAIVIVSAAGSYLAWDMQFKPFAEFTRFQNRFGNMGTVVFIFQYLYYAAETMLFLAIVVFAQEFGERAFQKKFIPWGGIFCGLTWGLVHILTQDFFTGIYSLLGAISYGVVYLLAKKNIRYAYIIIAIMFVT